MIRLNNFNFRIRLSIRMPTLWIIKPKNRKIWTMHSWMTMISCLLVKIQSHPLHFQWVKPSVMKQQKPHFTLLICLQLTLLLHLHQLRKDYRILTTRFKCISTPFPEPSKNVSFQYPFWQIKSFMTDQLSKITIKGCSRKTTKSMDRNFLQLDPLLKNIGMDSLQHSQFSPH